MLEAILGAARHAIACDDYVITRAYNGQDTVSFTLSRRDPAVMLLRERVRVYETTGGQTYLVSGIDAGQTSVSYVLKKDLSDWEQTVYPGYTNSTKSATAETTIRGVLPTGWTLVQRETDTLAAYISLQGPTALEVADHCREVFGCALEFDTAQKTATMHFPSQKTLGSAFLVETANLRAAPEYKSKAGSLVTRLYAQGAEGMDFSEINNGKSYVECFDYTDELVAGFWRDDRYTVPEHLLQAAREKVKSLSQPERSWTLQAADLSAVDPSAWPGMELGLYDVVKLIDPSLGQQMEVQITELRSCPHHPERNEISIETRNSTIRSLSAAIRAERQRDGLYQDLVVTVDQLKQDSTILSGTVENIRLESGTSLTDYVEEQGQYGLWYYRKWNSGQVELWGSHTVRPSSVSSMGSGYRSGSLSLYLPFPVTAAMAVGNVGSGCWIGGLSASGTGVSFYLAGPESLSTSTDYTVHLVVRGKWK